MVIDDLVFPVISMSGRLMVSARSVGELARGTRTGIKSGYFKKLIVIDSKGNRIRISGATPRGLGNPLLLLGWLIGFPLPLRLQVADLLPSLDLDQFKEAVSNQIDRDRGFWNSVAIGADGLKKRVQDAPSFGEIILLFV